MAKPFLDEDAYGVGSKDREFEPRKHFTCDFIIMYYTHLPPLPLHHYVGLSIDPLTDRILD